MRGEGAVGGLETCRGARAVHSVFALCRLTITLSHLPSFTGRAEPPAALQLPCFLATLDLYVIGIEPTIIKFGQTLCPSDSPCRYPL
jgi:hypothetical protein